MKTKKIVSLLLSVMIFTLSSVSAMFVQADDEVSGENYSSEIPASLLAEMFSGAYNGKWQVYNSHTGAAVLSDKSFNALTSNTATNINFASKGLRWYSKSGSSAIVTGKFKNTYLVATFIKEGNDYIAYQQNGAAGIGLKNSDASTGGFAAVIANSKYEYKNTAYTPTWGGYNNLSGYAAASKTDTAVWETGLVTDNSYLAVGLMAESNVDLENTYITVLTTQVSGYANNAARAVTGVPISRYYDDSEKGTYKEIAIPVSDFDVSNDWVVSEFINTNTSALSVDDSIYSTKPAPNFAKIIGAGLMKVYQEGASDVTENHMVYLTKTQFLNVAAPSNAATEKVSGDSTGYYEKLTFTPSNDSDVTAYEISLKDTSGNTLFTKTVPVSEFATEADGKLLYIIGAASPQGAVYSISAVCGEVVGNENIGYAPVKSGAVTAATKWDAGSSQYNPVYSMKYTVSGGNTVNVIGRVFYDCRVIVARYSSDGQALVQSDMFNPLGDVCRVTYDTAIGNDTIKVFIWSNDDSNTPLIGAAVTAGENVTK